MLCALGLGVALVAWSGGQVAGEEPAPAIPTPPAVSPGAGWVPWTALRFRASKLFLSATSTVTVEMVPVARAREALVPVRRGKAVMPSGPTVALVTTASDLPFGRDEVVSVWVDPDSGAALQFEKLVTGHNPYHKVSRYVAGGTFTVRTAPRDDRQARAGADEWTRRKEIVASSPVPLPEGAVLSDSYVLLYWLSAARLDIPGRTLAMYILSDDHLVELSFDAGDLTMRPGYERTTAAGSEPARREVVARRVSVSARAVGDPAAGGDIDLGFLGLRGNLTVFVEQGTGIPVELSGRASSIGNITVRLESATLADTTTPAPGG